MPISIIEPAPPSPPKPPRGPTLLTTVALRPMSNRVAHDFSRTRLESRLAIRDTADDLADPWQPILGARFSLLDVTSGLPDDSRDADERREERALRDLRGRVKRARAVIASTPGVAEVLDSDPRRAAMFYGRFGMARHKLLSGVRGDGLAVADLGGPLPVPPLFPRGGPRPAATTERAPSGRKAPVG